jgi:alkylation response protein AidB-like acyl-CoA dehydrogenase
LVGYAAYALARAGLLRASLMAGGCQDVLERTARYARERYQFGQPIGGFQAMQLRAGKRANRLRELHEALVVRPEGGLW